MRRDTWRWRQAQKSDSPNKVTHEIFYTVKSDTQADVWYTVRFNRPALQWQCSCPATKPCKHERAVNAVLRERRAHIAVEMGGEVPAIVARMQAEEDHKLHEAAKREQYVSEFSIY